MLSDISPCVRIASEETFRFAHRNVQLLQERVIFDYCLVFVKEGRYEITVNGKPHICNSGDVHLYRPACVHSSRSLDSTFHQLAIHFYLWDYDVRRYFTPFSLPDDPEKYRPLFLADRIDECGVIFPDCFTPSDPDQTEKLFAKVVSDFNKAHTDLYSLTLKTSMLSLLTHLLTDIDAQERARISPQLSQMNQVKDYIDLNCTGPVTLEELETQFYLSKYYIVQQFTRFFGISPIKYCTQQRIERAKLLLANPMQSVGNISEALGYNDIQSFSRAFKRCTGVSPQSFRQSVR